MASSMPAPLHIIQCRRYAKQDGWLLDDISLCSSGNIAVCGRDEDQSFVSIYGSTTTDDNSDSRDKPTLLYHKQFTEQSLLMSGLPRCISFIKPNSTEIVTCRYNEVQVIDYNRDVVLRSRKVNSGTTCLSVSVSQIFIGLQMSDIVNIYDNDLNEIKSIRLKGIRKLGWPMDIAAAADRLCVCASRAFVYSQDCGSILTEYTIGQDRHASSIAVNKQLGLTTVLCRQSDTGQTQIIFYRLSENKSFLTVNVESDVSRIRISDQDRIVTGNVHTGKVKIYNLEDRHKGIVQSQQMKPSAYSMTDTFQEDRHKGIVQSQQMKPSAYSMTDTFQLLAKKLTDEWKTLGRKLRLDEPDIYRIERDFRGTEETIYQMLQCWKKKEGSSATYAVLVTALEEVGRKDLAEKVQPLKDISTMCTFEKFVAGFSTFLTSDLFEAVCKHFNISKSEKSDVLSDNAPGLSLLALLKAKNIITPTDVSALAIPAFANFKLVMEKINRYQRDLRESKITLLELQRELTLEDLDKLRIRGAVSQEGGTIQIPDSSVTLRIPPNAFWEDNIEHSIEMRIIPRGTYDQPAKSFTDNSAVMVELLPNNLSLRLPAELTLPHCLKLREVQKCKVSIYVSHHDEGLPNWKEITSITHHELSENYCKIWLDRFCWVKYEIDGKEVEAKKLIVYTAGHTCKVNADRVIVDVGYYPEMIGANELLQKKLKNSFVADEQHFLLRKEPKNPLQITVVETIPDEWKASRSSSSPQTISYFNIASSNEKSCPFVFQRHTEVPCLPICIFSLSQGEESTKLSIDMDKQRHGKHKEDLQTPKSDEGPLSKDQYCGALDLVPPRLVTQYQQMTLYQGEERTVLSRSQVASSKDDAFGTNVLSVTTGAAASLPPPSYSPSSLPVYGMITFRDLSALAKCLDPENCFGTNWRLLADKLGFKVDDITYFGTRSKSPTLDIISTAIKQGILKSRSQLIDILKAMGREDAASAISGQTI